MPRVGGARRSVRRSKTQSGPLLCREGQGPEYAGAGAGRWYVPLGIDPIDLEESFQFPILPGRSEVVDLAIFRPGEPHVPPNVAYVVDRSSRQEDAARTRLGTLFGYLPGVRGGVWDVDGLPRFYKNSRGTPVPVPNLPGEASLGVAAPSAFDLSGTLIALHNHIYANDGLSAGEAFSEVMKLLFLKIEDEKRNGGRASHDFRIEEPEFSELMAGKKGGKSEGFLDRLHGLFARAKADYPSVFRADEALHLRPGTLAVAVSRFQSFSLADCPFDVKGTAFQRIVSAAHRGDRGQFFTPGPVVRLMVEFLDPQSGEVLLDPACGTGGFLIQALRHLRAHGESANKARVFGIEINPSVARVTMMQMILSGGDPHRVICGDALGQADLPHDLDGKVDVLLTNPPFGSQGKISEEGTLRRFDLGHAWARNEGGFKRTDEVCSGQVPDILFIERCLQYLRPGGRMGIVLPNGDLENSSLGHVRAFIKSKADILAVVTLPQETFVPFGTGVKASLLFLERRRSSAADRSRKVFFGIVEKIGYDGGKHFSETYKRDESGSILRAADGSPIVDEDVTALAAAYREFAATGRMAGAKNRFWRNAGDMEDRFDATFYLPEHESLVKDLDARGALPLGSLVRMTSKRSPLLKHPAGEIRYIELSDVSVTACEVVNATPMRVFEAPSRATYEVRAGDIITAVSGNATGTPKHPTAYITKEFDGCVVSNGFRVLRATHVDPFFLLCALRTPAFLRQVFRYRTGAAIPAISDADLLRALIVVPSATEQKRISERIRQGMELRGKALDLFLAATEDPVFGGGAGRVAS